MRTLLVLAVLLLLLVASVAHAGPLEIMGAGVAYVQPFDGESDAEGALAVHMKLLELDEPDALTLKSAPEWMLSRLTLDALITDDNISLGIGTQLQVVETGLPVHIGIVRMSGQGWGWYIEMSLMKTDL